MNILLRHWLSMAGVSFWMLIEASSGNLPSRNERRVGKRFSFSERKKNKHK